MARRAPKREALTFAPLRMAIRLAHAISAVAGRRQQWPARLPRLYRGTHLELPQAERRVARRVELSLEEPVDTMIDGEVLRLRLRSVAIVPAALDVIA